MTEVRMKAVVGIDPANVETAAVICEWDSMHVWWKAKERNKVLLSLLVDRILELQEHGHDVEIVIEGLQSYGSRVGRSTFETGYWIGYLQCTFDRYRFDHDLIFRSEERKFICNSPRANDAQIRRALVDRFAPYEANFGKGNKKNPGFFYGFKQDIWQAFAIAYAYKLKVEEIWHQSMK